MKLLYLRGVKVKITKYDLELSRSGINVGDVVEGQYQALNKSIQFSGKGRFTEMCVAWLGVNCEKVA